VAVCIESDFTMLEFDGRLMHVMQLLHSQLKRWRLGSVQRAYCVSGAGPATATVLVDQDQVCHKATQTFL
jgi:hypothetical protein